MLHPLLFLLGLGAIPVAIWVHLRLGKVKKRKVVSTLSLMSDSRQSSRTPRRIVNWPLLLLRSLIALLVALGFAKIAIPWLGKQTPAEYAVLVVDNSASMQANGEKGSNWQLARDQADATLNALSSNSKVCLVTSPGGPAHNDWLSPSRARQLLAQIQPGNSANQIGQAISTASRKFNELPDDSPKNLYVVSDFQQSSLSELNPQNISLPHNVKINLLQVSQPNLINRGLKLVRRQAGINSLSEISFADGGSGQISFSRAGQPGTDLTLPAKSPSHSYSLFAPAGQWLTSSASFATTDAIAADNRVNDAFAGSGQINAIVWEPYAIQAQDPRFRSRTLNSQNSRKRQPENAYDLTGYYLACALDPASGLDSSNPGALAVVRHDKNSLASLISELESSANPRQILFIPAESNIQELRPAIERVTQLGGSVILFGGSDLKPDSYNASLKDLLPVTFSSIADNEEGVNLAPIEQGHALWAPLDPAITKELESFAFRTRALCALAPDSSALHSFADGVPFIASRRVANGKVYFVNTSPDREWSDLPAAPNLFLPTIHLLSLDSVKERQPHTERSTCLAGESLTLDFGPATANTSITYNGKKFTTSNDGRVTLPADSPGLFELTDSSGKTIHQLAVNFPPSESILDFANPAVLRQSLEALASRNTQARSVTWENLRDGELAWQLCFALAALLLLAEPIIANKRSI